MTPHLSDVHQLQESEGFFRLEEKPCCMSDHSAGFSPMGTWTCDPSLNIASDLIMILFTRAWANINPIFALNWTQWSEQLHLLRCWIPPLASAFKFVRLYFPSSSLHELCVALALAYVQYMSQNDVAHTNNPEFVVNGEIPGGYRKAVELQKVASVSQWRYHLFM